ncbi:MAG TPA: CbrC family protein [Chitinophagaceae bacterium]|nr:CbrC family protein [Chitinophagaceae bacterium]
MQFTYFEGPVGDMGDFLGEKKKCSIWKQEHEYCFSLNYAITYKFSDAEKEGKIGCYDCLKKGEFEFWHDTEFGFLDESGLKKAPRHTKNTSHELPVEWLADLRRTPQIVTYQEEFWLTHCNDFMIYKGTWSPPDFYINSTNGDGRDLFMEMTDVNLSHLWDQSLPEGQTLLQQWYPTYYVFGCRHCNKLRGYWDCD